MPSTLELSRSVCDTGKVISKPEWHAINDHAASGKWIDAARQRLNRELIEMAFASSQSDLLISVGLSLVPGGWAAHINTNANAPSCWLEELAMPMRRIPKSAPSGPARARITTDAICHAALLTRQTLEESTAATIEVSGTLSFSTEAAAIGLLRAKTVDIKIGDRVVPCRALPVDPDGHDPELMREWRVNLIGSSAS